MELIRFVSVLSLGLTGLCLVMLPLLDRPHEPEENAEPARRPWSL